MTNEQVKADIAANLPDNTAGSGTVMAVIDLSTVTVPTSLPFNCDFTTGLTLVTTSTSDITAVYE